MIKQMCFYWRSHPLGFILLFIGYFIGILLMSAGASFIHQSYNYAMDSNSGNPEHNQIISLISPQNSIHYEDLKKIVLASDKESVFNFYFQNSKIDIGVGKMANLTGVFYKNKPEWEPPLLSGRYLAPSEATSSMKKAVLGKDLANKLFPNGIKTDSTILINKESYNVIGVIGRKMTPTQWDNLIYVPLMALPVELKNSPFDQILLLVTKNGGAPNSSVDFLVSELNKTVSDIKVNLPVTTKQDTGLWENIVTVSFVSGLILVVSMINITNLTLFWVLERREEIGIRKLLGATDFNIFKLIIFEILSVSILAAFFAIIIQIVTSLILKMFNIELEISWINFFVSFGTATLCGLITAAIPARMTTKMEPIVVLKSI